METKPLLTGKYYDQLFHYVYPMEEGETLEEYVERRLKEKIEDNIQEKD